MTPTARPPTVIRELQGTHPQWRVSEERRFIEYNWLNRDLQCSLYPVLFCVGECVLCICGHTSANTPTVSFTFIRLLLIFMRRLVAGVSRWGANERSVRACRCVRACTCRRCRGQNCNQITAAPSSPPSSTTSGAPSVHANANMLRYTPACGSAQEAADVCVRVFVRAWWIMVRGWPR